MTKRKKLLYGLLALVFLIWSLVVYKMYRLTTKTVPTAEVLDKPIRLNLKQARDA